MLKMRFANSSWPAGTPALHEHALALSRESDLEVGGCEWWQGREDESVFDHVVRIECHRCDFSDTILQAQLAAQKGQRMARILGQHDADISKRLAAVEIHDDELARSAAGGAGADPRLGRNDLVVQHLDRAL